MRGNAVFLHKDWIADARIPYITLRKPMIPDTMDFPWNRGIPAARILYKTCRKSMMRGNNKCHAQHANQTTRIPYKAYRKPMIQGARIFLGIQKIHAARLPYKPCRKYIIPLTDFPPQRRKLLLSEYLIKPVENHGFRGQDLSGDIKNPCNQNAL